MLAKHGLIYLASKILPAVLSLAMMAVFTRLLTPEQYGSYSLTILIAGLANAVCLQWVILGVGRYLPDCQNDVEQQKLLATARALTLLISVILVFLFLLVNKSNGLISFSAIFYMIGFIAASQAWYDLNLKIQNADLNPASYVLTLGAKSIVAFGLGTLFVYFGYGAEGASIAVAIALIVASLLNINLWRAVLWKNFDKNQFAKLWRYGAPLTITFLLIFIIDASDRFFIDKILGAQSLGVYSAAYEFTQYSIGTLMAVVHLAAFPLVINAFSKQGEAATRVQLRKTFVFVLAIIMPSACGLAIVSNNVAGVVMGVEFSKGAASIIPWIALAMFFSCIKSFYFDYAFQLANSTQVQLLAVAIAAVVNLVLNYLLIPVYGVLGAAAATAISFFIALIASIFFGLKVFSMPPLPLFDAMKIILSTILMAFSISFITVNNQYIELILQVSLGAIIYTALLFATNVMNIQKIILSQRQNREMY